uniref:Transmembrane protein 14C n=1 Tax=Terrapene triunguis TaxID=2587831 RepID=A0A674HV86_9SAUR
MGLDWVGFGYAALVTSGGIIGYAKAGSVPSLAAGLLFGSLAGLGAYQLSQNPKNALAFKYQLYCTSGVFVCRALSDILALMENICQAKPAKFQFEKNLLWV